MKRSCGMTSQLRYPLSFGFFLLFLITFPGLVYGWKSDLDYIQKWEKQQIDKAQAPFLLGGAWDQLKETSNSTYAAAGANSLAGRIVNNSWARKPAV